MAIVHNSNYLRIFEEARLFFMDKIGIPYTKIEDAGILIPQVDAYVRYHQTLKYGDELCADVKMTEYNGARMKYEYQIYRGSDEALIAEGFTSHCFIQYLYLLYNRFLKKFWGLQFLQVCYANIFF